MKYLVTGGAGFIGSNLALALQAQGHSVLALDDFSSGSHENLSGLRGDVVTWDVFDAGWAGRVGAVDGIFHLAAVTDTTALDEKRMMEVNVEGFRNVLHYALEAGTQRVVYASSAGVYGRGPCPMRESQELKPLNAYAFSKMAMDQLAGRFARENPEVSVLGLRYFNVYGPREQFKKKAASMVWQLAGQMRGGRRPRIFKGGEQTRDFVYVQDAVEATIKAMESAKSGVVNVCTGRAATFNKIIEILNIVLGTAFEPEYFENPYGFYQDHTLGDPRAAKALIGFEAKWSIEEGIRDYLGGAKVEAGRG